MSIGRKRSPGPCCTMMAADLSRTCDVHADRSDCPDCLVSASPSGYGLYVHDGGSSVIEITFCPWCGSRLT